MAHVEQYDFAKAVLVNYSYEEHAYDYGQEVFVACYIAPDVIDFSHLRLVLLAKLVK